MTDGLLDDELDETLLREELKRKNKLIDKLRQENASILRTALKQNQENIELKQRLKSVLGTEEDSEENKKP